MILESIQLENIRSYEKESIDFPRGITLFEGDIGSGKSTVLMGIEFALFGSGSAKPDGILAKKAKEGGVILRFKVDDKTYEIKRVLKRHNGKISPDNRNSYLKIDGELYPLSTTELKQSILEILKFNEPENPRATSKIFRYAVFTPQEEMRSILQDKSKRLETIRRAFRIEDYKIATDNAKNLNSNIRNSMASLTGRFANMGELCQQLEDSQQKSMQINSDIKKLDSDKQELEKDEKSQKEKVQESEAKLHDKTRLQGKQGEISADIKGKKNILQAYSNTVQENKKESESIKEKLKNLDHIQNPTSKTMTLIQKEIADFEEIKNDIIRKESEIKSVQNNLENMMTKLADYTKNTEELKKQLKSLEDALEKDQEKSDALKNKHQELNSIKIGFQKDCENFAQSIKDVKKLGSKCHYCGHELTQEHLKEQESERQEKLAQAQEKMQQIDKQCKNVESEIKDIENVMLDTKNKINTLNEIIPILQEHAKEKIHLDALNAQLDELNKKNKIIQEDTFPNDGKYDDPVSYLLALKDALVQYENSSKQKQDLKERLEKADITIKRSQAQSDETKEQILDLEKKLASAKAELGAYEKVDQDISQKKLDLEKIQRELQTLRDKIASNNADLKNQNSNIERLTSEIKNAEKWKNKHEIFKEYQDWLENFFIPAISEIEKQVMLSIQNSFHENYRSMYNTLIDDPTKDSHIDEEFTPIIRQDGYDQEIDNLSGGEKTSIALAYRLTLNSMMRKETDSLKSNLLILDEPTDGLSKYQLSKVRTLLEDLNSQQIILVSHEKELEAYVDHIFHVSKNAGVSCVTASN